MQPEQIAKDSESSHQTALFAWVAQELRKENPLPLKRLFHVPNGGTRGEDERSRKIAGGKMKAEGVRSGVPDLCLPVSRLGYHGLWIEMKKPSQKREDNLTAGCSDTQLEWLADLKAEGYACFVAYSWIEARDGILWYLKGE